MVRRTSLRVVLDGSQSRAARSAGLHDRVRLDLSTPEEAVGGGQRMPTREDARHVTCDAAVSMLH